MDLQDKIRKALREAYNAGSGASDWGKASDGNMDEVVEFQMRELGFEQDDTSEIGFEDKREMLAENNPDALLMDGFEDAFIGICSRHSKEDLAAYDYDKCIEILESQGMTREEAIEYFSFNCEGAWAGKGTPVIIHRFE